MRTNTEIIKQAVKRYKTEQFIVLYSGGRDSTVTLDSTIKAIKELGLKIPLKIQYWNTGINLSENQEFVESKASKLGLELIQLQPKSWFTHEALYERFGFLSVGGHRMALGFLKWFGFREFARLNKEENICYVSGRRKLESNTRTKMNSNKPIDMPESNMKFCSPLYYLTNNQRDLYLDKYNLTASPCYETVHTDGNCQCGCYAQSDELKMMYLFHKDLFDKIMKIDDRLGGIRNVKIVLDKDKGLRCIVCDSKKLIRGKNRFLNGIHSYIYWCMKCGNKTAIPDEKMPYEWGLKNMGHWGNGVNPPPRELMDAPEDLVCRSCKLVYESKQLVKAVNRNKSKAIIPQYSYPYVELKK